MPRVAAPKESPAPRGRGRALGAASPATSVTASSSAAAESGSSGVHRRRRAEAPVAAVAEQESEAQAAQSPVVRGRAKSKVPKGSPVLPSVAEDGSKQAEPPAAAGDEPAAQSPAASRKTPLHKAAHRSHKSAHGPQLPSVRWMRRLLRAPGALAAGGPLSRYPPCFSADGKLLVCCAASVARVFSVATGLEVGVLRGHTDLVTAVLRHPLNSLQVLTCSLDGSVRAWDVHDFSLLRVYDVGAPVLHAALPRDAAAAGGSVLHMYLNVNPKLFKPHRDHRSPAAPAAVGDAAATAPAAAAAAAAAPAVGARDDDWDYRNSCRVLRLDLASGASTALFKSRQCSGLAVSSPGDFVVAVAARTLFVWNVASARLAKLQHVRALTTVAVHPTEHFLATGDVDGQITLWYRHQQLFGTGAAASVASPSTPARPRPSAVGARGPVVTSSLHWHAHGVRALAFSTDGAYLLSGGEEAVLVVWQVETGHRQFLPRLGGTLRGLDVGADGRLYALACDHNAVLVVNAVSSRVEQTVRGLQLSRLAGAASDRPASHHHQPPHAHGGQHQGAGAAPLPHQLQAAPPLTVDPSSGLLVVASTRGALQFYDALRDRHVAELVVVPRNTVSRTEEEQQLTTRLEHVAASADGAWLATVERRPDAPGASGALALKLWRAADAAADARAGRFELNTRVNAPHKGRVCATAFHPRRALLVTAAADSTFKLWEPVEVAAAPAVARGKVARDGEDAAALTTAWRCNAVRACPVRALRVP